MDDVGVQPQWQILADGAPRTSTGDGLSRRRLLLRVLAAAIVVVVAVTGASLLLARQIAEREAVAAAAQVSDLLAESVVQGALEDDLLSLDPAAATAARQRLDGVVRDRVLKAAGLVRVKVWDAQGRIVYSDETRLIGRTFPLEEEELQALSRPRLEAEVTDLDRPENELERGRGKLLEVYRPVWTPTGQPLLFETYTPYAQVTTRTGQLWRSFAGLLVSSLLLLVVLLVPVLWALLERLRRNRVERETLLQDAVDASARERQRIAATLHDGVVQELVATSYVVAAAAQRAQRAQSAQHGGSTGSDETAGTSEPNGTSAQLQEAAGAVRSSIAGLRSLLLDIYPPSLHDAGLATAVGDLAGSGRSQGMVVDLQLPDPHQSSGLDLAGERLVFQVAQETLRNAVSHSRAHHLSVHLRYEQDHVRLDVADDGVGFEPAAAQHAAEDGHFGLRLLPDLARQGGARLRLATAPRAGTRWRLEVPHLQTAPGNRSRSRRSSAPGSSSRGSVARGSSERFSS
ncbi:sensor histidine kinase [Kineococcus radiotolerans]|uniref:sensor histidine kinase n=1 Tax=Kineococcus radiotolerans TaxID=131568 RepID=UPI0012FEB9C7|nr:ATP-binding protein [Kineococcus radiotolerans]